MKRVFHPAADIYPLLCDERLDDRADDIREHGLLNPIQLLDGKIIDGRNRYLACGRAGIEPTTIDIDPPDCPIAYVRSLNEMRRHLSTSQLAMVAANAKEYFAAEAKERQKRKPSDSVVANLPPQNGKSRDKVGEAFNVSGRSVDAASKVKANGTKSLNDAVEGGTLAVSTAAKIAAAPKATQDDIVEQIQAGETTGAKAAAELRAKSKAKIAKGATQGDIPAAKDMPPEQAAVDSRTEAEIVVERAAMYCARILTVGGDGCDPPNHGHYQEIREIVETTDPEVLREVIQWAKHGAAWYAMTLRALKGE